VGEYRVKLVGPGSCGRKPLAELFLAASEAAPGDLVVVEANPLYYPLERIKSYLEVEGLRIVDVRDEGASYIVVAVKKG